MWVFILLINFFTAAAKTLIVECKEVDEVCHAPQYHDSGTQTSEVSIPRTCSFTDQFLAFLRERSQAITAAEQIAAEDDENFQPGWVEEGEGQHRVEGDVSVLQQRGGDRSWRFYRPDPFDTGRSTFMNIQVNADQSLESVERRIAQRWPDLTDPAVRWRLLEVHESVHNSIYVEDEVEVFLLEANIDLLQGNVPILKEVQFWDIVRGVFYGTLEPITRYHIMRGISQMYVDVRGHECHSKPCFGTLNGDSLQAWEEYNVNSGDFLLVASVATVRDTTQVIGYWADFVGQPLLTQAFGRRVGNAMRTAIIPEEKGQNNAFVLQRAMLSTYRNLYEQTNAAILRPDNTLCIASADNHYPDEPHSVRMTEMQWSTQVSYEFPLLMEALVESDMITHSWDGQFVHLHDSVRLLTLPRAMNVINQYIIIKTVNENDELNIGLAEVRLDTHPEPMQIEDYMTMLFYGPARITSSDCFSSCEWIKTVMRMNASSLSIAK